MSYATTVRDIKSLKIQGAERIAIAAVEAFAEILKTNNKQKIARAYRELIGLRATEPALRNALAYCRANYTTDKHVANTVKKHFIDGQKRIATLGAQKIKNGMTVFTHCHSSTVEAILIEAHRQGKKFTVMNTETRPKFQGRTTAINLAKAGIRITHMVDSAGPAHLKKADIFLFGCDSISGDGSIINKIGTEMLANVAHTAHTPAYTCTNSWKFNPETLHGHRETIEQRDPKEVWDKPPKGVTVINPAFEIIAPALITGAITELGIIKPKTIATHIAVAYPWLIQQRDFF